MTLMHSSAAGGSLNLIPTTPSGFRSKIVTFSTSPIFLTSISTSNCSVSAAFGSAIISSWLNMFLIMMMRSPRPSSTPSSAPQSSARSFLRIAAIPAARFFFASVLSRSTNVSPFMVKVAGVTLRGNLPSRKSAPSASCSTSGIDAAFKNPTRPSPFSFPFSSLYSLILGVLPSDSSGRSTPNFSKNSATSASVVSSGSPCT
mmetsp:Transcript_9387/g.18758  ORF Transcript_9387/g.18758 Transcript_9387/m.18758 type:complete len:202 (-) Transcript_9387:726-1331(-)